MGRYDSTRPGQLDRLTAKIKDFNPFIRMPKGDQLDEIALNIIRNTVFNPDPSTHIFSKEEDAKAVQERVAKILGNILGRIKWEEK